MTKIIYQNLREWNSSLFIMEPGNFIINYKNQLYQQWAENECGMRLAPKKKKMKMGWKGGKDEKK